MPIAVQYTIACKRVCTRCKVAYSLDGLFEGACTVTHKSTHQIRVSIGHAQVSHLSTGCNVADKHAIFSTTLAPSACPFVAMWN